MRKQIGLILFCAMLAPPALAQDHHVVPMGYENQPGTTSFLLLTGGPRSYQMLIHEDQLSDLVGRNLTALTWRLPGIASVNWPSTDATFDNFDIYLGPSVAPEDRSFEFAENAAGPQDLVRSGSLTIPANSFVAGGSPTAFGFEIEFDTPWEYTGGHLLIETRDTGHDVNNRSMDAIGTAVPGYGTQFSALWQSSYTPTIGSQGNFVVVQLTAEEDETACPGDLTGSGTVGVADLLILLGCWGPVGPDCTHADLTGDGNVGVQDLLVLLGNWGPCPR